MKNKKNGAQFDYEIRFDNWLDNIATITAIIILIIFIGYVIITW